MARLRTAELKSADKKGLTRARGTRPAVVDPFMPALPDVNLLPPRVSEAVAARKARHKLLLAAAVLATLVAGTYMAQTAQIMIANSGLEAESTKGVALDKQVRDLAPVKRFYAAVAAQKATVQSTMARELLFSQVATELLKNTTKGVQVKTMTVSAPAEVGAPAGAGSACPAANPFKPLPMVTCVQFTGTAAGRGSVSAFLMNLNASDKFANVYVPVTDSGDGLAVTFSGSVGITDKFFSNRYADDAYLLKGVGAQR